jgi:hypothetical protein
MKIKKTFSPGTDFVGRTVNPAIMKLSHIVLAILSCNGLQGNCRRVTLGAHISLAQSLIKKNNNLAGSPSFSP